MEYEEGKENESENQEQVIWRLKKSEENEDSIEEQEKDDEEDDENK